MRSNGEARVGDAGGVFSIIELRGARGRGGRVLCGLMER